MESKATDQQTSSTAEQQMPNLGRIQVASRKNRKIFIYAARRQFAAKPTAPETIVITALASAIQSAIAIAHELESQGVCTITDVKTFFTTIEGSPTQAPPPAAGEKDQAAAQPKGARLVARIAITVTRNPAWKPEPSDEQRPARRSNSVKPPTGENDVAPSS